MKQLFLPRGLIAIALLGIGAPALAQDSVISAAKAAGQVGEQSDGYLGIRGSPGAAVRDAVEDLNIKRREAYTALAIKRGVTVVDMARITACQTLATRVSQGQIYRIGKDDWQVKGSQPIALPDYCAASGQ